MVRPGHFGRTEVYRWNVFKGIQTELANSSAELLIIMQTTSSTQRVEQAHDILHQVTQHPLDAIFSPKVVAVIGATENKGSVGRTVFQNMGRGGFQGVVYPVNPKRASVLSVKAYPSIGALPEKADLAVITTPASTVPGLIKECAAAGVKGVIIISAGFLVLLY